MLPPELTTAIDLFKYSQTTVGSLWGIYGAVSLALLGYILGAKGPIPGRGKVGLAVAFAIFAGSNATSLWRFQNIGYSAAKVIKAFAPPPSPSPLSELLCTLRVSSPYLLVGFQLFLSVCALAAIYAAHRHDVVAARR
jgi:hypothetical protein